MKWFRMHNQVMDDPKLMSLDAKVLKTWLIVLCIASKHGPSIAFNEELAFRCRLRKDHLKKHLDALAESGLIDVQGECFQPHGWAKWQYQSDTSTERTRKHKQGKGNVPGNVPGTAAGTVRERPQSTDTDNRVQSSAAVETPKQMRAGGSAASPLDWSGPDPTVEIRKLVSELAHTWPDPGDIPTAATVAEREYANSGADVTEWCAKVRRSEAAWRAHYESKLASRPGQFVPHLAKWLKSGEYSRPAPKAAVAVTGQKDELDYYWNVPGR